MSESVHNSFVRREKKFLIPREKYEVMLPVIAENAVTDVYCTDKSGYPIHTVYFDTDSDNVIRYSLSSPYHKEKLRMRFYSMPDSPDSTVFLEMKNKTRGVVSKRRIALRLEEASSLVSLRIPPKAMTAPEEQIVREMLYFLSRDDFYPKVDIYYKRIAFQTPDGRTRITFDYDVFAARLGKDEFVPSPSSPLERLIPEDKMLLEVKFVDSVPLWLARLMSSNGVFSISFSKYGSEYKRDLVSRLSEKAKTSGYPDASAGSGEEKITIGPIGSR